MYGIRIDEETRQFSVIDTREFGLKVGLIRGIRYKDNYTKRDSRRAHKERMAMIKAGMDPSTIEDYKSKKLHEKYGYKGHKLDVGSENAAGKRALAEHQMDLRSGDKRDYRANRTKRVAIRKLR